MKRGVPDRGDILHIDLDPTTGHEQRGKRFVLVLSPLEFNRFGLILGCPITQGGEFAREHGFPVSLSSIVGPQEKDRLLKKYWIVPERQVETSVVLVDANWRARLQ